MKLEFSRHVFEKTQSSIKICPVGAELSHVDTDRQIDGHDETVYFRNFANAPKNIKFFFHSLIIKMDPPYILFISRKKSQASFSY